MSFYATDDRETPRITPAVQWVIAINVAIYFLQLTVVSPADMLSWLAFRSPGNLTARPWTIVTYMFVHGGFLHLLFNMWALWIFGPRVEQAWGSRSFSFYYLLCGLGGWLAHLLFVHPSGILLGASAAIFGVMLAYAVRWPDDEIALFPFVFISIKVKWLVALLAAWNLVMGVLTMHGVSGVAYMAHLGGFAVGWLYLRAASAPGLDRLRHRMSQIPDVSDDEPPRAIPRSRERSRERTSEIDEIVARSNAMVKRPSAAASLSAKVGKKKTDELNLVLDKISERGLGSLTSEERRLLEEMSRRLRST